MTMPEQAMLFQGPSASVNPARSSLLIIVVINDTPLLPSSMWTTCRVGYGFTVGYPLRCNFPLPSSLSSRLSLNYRLPSFNLQIIHIRIIFLARRILVLVNLRLLITSCHERIVQIIFILLRPTPWISLVLIIAIDVSPAINLSFRLLRSRCSRHPIFVLETCNRKSNTTTQTTPAKNLVPACVLSL